MSDIKDWSNSAGGNTSASPDGWPENMAPSGVNDSARENMAALRRQHEDAEWIDRGETPSFATTASFTLAGDLKDAYHAGRRIKASDSVNTLYGTISSSTYSATTRVSVTLDSGEFTSSLTGVAVGILSYTNQSLPENSNTPYAKLAEPNTFIAKQVFDKGFAASATSTFTSKVVFKEGFETSATATLSSPIIKTPSSNGDVYSGTYTPVVANLENITGTPTVSDAQYMRVGNVVTVSGSLLFIPTVTATVTRFTITLPIASDFSAATSLGGTGARSSSVSLVTDAFNIYGVIITDTGKFEGYPIGTNNEECPYSFTYLIET